MHRMLSVISFSFGSLCRGNSPACSVTDSTAWAHRVLVSACLRKWCFLCPACNEDTYKLHNAPQSRAVALGRAVVIAQAEGLFVKNIETTGMAVLFVVKYKLAYYRCLYEQLKQGK